MLCFLRFRCSKLSLFANIIYLFTNEVNIDCIKSCTKKIDILLKLHLVFLVQSLLLSYLLDRRRLHIVLPFLVIGRGIIHSKRFCLYRLPKLSNLRRGFPVNTFEVRSQLL